MIVDIGGGTTDVAVISLGGIVASTSVKCAGNAMDHAIADYIRKTFNLTIGDKMAEEVKIRIGSAVPHRGGIDDVGQGPRPPHGPAAFHRTLDQRSRARHRAGAPHDGQCDERRAGGNPAQVAADIIDNGIIMTGARRSYVILPSSSSAARGQMPRRQRCSLLRCQGYRRGTQTPRRIQEGDYFQALTSLQKMVQIASVS